MGRITSFSPVKNKMPDKSELGKRIKKIREHRHLTLKNIEAEAGISATHISEIERGKTSPTLGALIRIADALGKDPAYFIEEEDLGDTSTVTLENRIRESLSGGGGTLERLTSSIPGGRLQACIITLDGGSGRHEVPHSHYGSETALVLSGSVVFAIGDDTYQLEEGDAITYPAGQAHNFSNASKRGSASLLWVCNDRSAT